jgi:hypothetical protein
MAHFQHGPAKGASFLGRLDVVNEGFIDLDMVEREGPENDQGGIARAEIIKG